ncbi:MAG: dihydropteroate synthase [Planctomycetota bacterium]|nr:MAG: dihydropteroate synthase [Planctomycetota bacterium]
MGIVNVTPDSFSDGGKFLDPEAAVEHGRRLAADGADILDIGGESTRPYAEPVSLEEERRRVLPVIERLAAECDVPISVDTSKPEVAEAALQAGAVIVNDVTAARDARMIEVVRRFSAGICLMHMQGTPQSMQDSPHYHDVVGEISAFLAERARACEAAGIAREQIVVDPGIGFGKLLDHNLQILQRIRKFRELGYPILVGHSRKRFLRQLVPNSETAPLYGTIGVALALAKSGVEIVRVHNVRAVREAMTTFAAAGGIED